MSRLYYSEHGHVISNLAEEVTTFRRARKILDLPATAHPARLFILARPRHPGDLSLPLRLSVNGTELPPIMPADGALHRWYEGVLPSGSLHGGSNTFDFWCDSTSMTGWSIALEPGHATTSSRVTDDSGSTWRSDHMGYLNALIGEYVVRLRLAEGSDPEPPLPVFEPHRSARLESLLRLVPEAARDERPVLERVRALSTWLATAWEHTGSDIATQFTPWDAETILSWGPSFVGHDARRPVVMCVQYGAAFVSAAQAVGIPARCAVFTGTPNGWDGHFCAEFWSEEHRKWVLVDPNMDAMFFDNGGPDGVPLSVAEVQQRIPELGGVAVFGPGTASQRRNPRIAAWYDQGYLAGGFFRHRAAWYRSDFLAHPELTPPAHGATAYCETGLVWDATSRGEFPMFPWSAGQGYFDAPPR